MGIMTFLTGLLGCAQNIDIDSKDEFTGIVALDDVAEGDYLKVTGCEFGTSGYTPGFNYRIYKSEEDSNVTLFDFETREDGYVTGTCEIDDATLDDISKLCKKLDIISWDKFDKSAKGVLDGSGFSLSVDFEDGTHIYATGSNFFPKNYGSFESTFENIIAPITEAERAKQCEEKYAAGAYSEKLEMAMINFKGRGASGKDEYSFLLRSNCSPAADITLKSVSGEFIEAGDYRYYGEADDIEEVLAKIQEVLEKYDVYKWDGYNKSTEDFNDREWFQFSFSYPEASINCYGCGDTEHYDEVRSELLTILIDSFIEKLQ